MKKPEWITINSPYAIRLACYNVKVKSCVVAGEEETLAQTLGIKDKDRQKDGEKVYERVSVKHNGLIARQGTKGIVFITETSGKLLTSKKIDRQMTEKDLVEFIEDYIDEQFAEGSDGMEK